MKAMRWGRAGAMALGVIAVSAAESAAQRFIPPGHRAGPGECQVWIDGVPPGHQPAPFRCDRGRRIAWAPVVRDAYLDWYLSQPWGFIDLRLDWDRYGIRAAFFDVAAILDFERFHRTRFLRNEWRGDRYWDRYYDGYRNVRWQPDFRRRFLRDVRAYRQAGRIPAAARVLPGGRAPRAQYRRGARSWRGDRDWDDDRWDDRRDRDRDRWEDRRERDRDRWEDRRDRVRDRYEDRWEDERDRWEDRRERDRDRWERDRGQRGRRSEVRRNDDRRRGPPANRGRGNGRGNRDNGRGGGGR